MLDIACRLCHLGVKHVTPKGSHGGVEVTTSRSAAGRQGTAVLILFPRRTTNYL